jgi:hypothetical protein
MAKIKLPASVRAQFAACGSKGGKAGKKSDKAKAGHISGDARKVKRQKRIDDAWARYKQELNGGGITSKAKYVRKFFPKVRDVDTSS